MSVSLLDIFSLKVLEILVNVGMKYQFTLVGIIILHILRKDIQSSHTLQEEQLSNFSPIHLYEIFQISDGSKSNVILKVVILTVRNIHKDTFFFESISIVNCFFCKLS